MRRLVFALAMVLAASPALAQQQSQTAPGGSDPVFGQTWCTPAFQCPSSLDAEAMRNWLPQILSQANACIAGRFAMRNPNGYFEETLGLDSNLCLTTKPIERASKGMVMVPKCCVQAVAGSNSLCQIVCVKYGMK